MGIIASSFVIMKLNFAYELTCTLFFISAALFANPSHHDNFVLTEDN